MNAHALAKQTPVDQLPVAAEHQPNPLMEMLSEAIRAGQPIEVIREIKAMVTEIKADEARQAFDAALSSAKAEIPVIRKNRKVGFEHKNGDGETNYAHEDLGEIARTVDPILSKFGLSYRYRSQQGDGRVLITCILSHRDGHSEETQLSAAPDASGKKNAIQQTGSAITYMQRYTLKLALGLAAASDDDGATSQAPDTIDKDQLETLRGLIDQTDTDIAKFCDTFKIDALPNLPAGAFDAAAKSMHIKLARKLSEAKDA